MYVAWRCPARTQFPSCWSILSASEQLFLSAHPIVDRTDPILEFGRMGLVPQQNSPG